MRVIVISIVLVVLMIAMCGHKAAPLSKDRLSPKLLKVDALNSTQIQFTFSENLDTLNLKPEFFFITHDQDTLSLKLLYPSLSAAEIIAISELQVDVIYTVSGSVYDPAENKGNFKKTFKGSILPDTIAPWLVSYSQGARQQSFRLQFSEAMDTSFLAYYVIPGKSMTHSWLNYRTCKITPDSSDTLNADTTYYLVLYNGAQDICSNKLDMFVTSITPDTILPSILLEGKVALGDTVAREGLAILRDSILVGVSLVQDGHFQFQIRDSAVYTIIVTTGQFSAIQEISPMLENVVTLEKQELNLDSILR